MKLYQPIFSLLLGLSLTTQISCEGEKQQRSPSESPKADNAAKDSGDTTESSGEASEQAEEEVTIEDLAQYPIYESRDITTFDEQAALLTKEPMVPVKLKNIFCEHSYKLPLKASFDEEIGYLCTNKQPNETFDKLDSYAQVSKGNPRAFLLNLQEDGNITTAAFATAVQVPITPKFVQQRPIEAYMTLHSHFEYVDLLSKITEDLNHLVGGDLRMSSARLKYRTRIVTHDGTIIDNTRNTEFNNYQVQGGNPDIGFGGEHLIDEANPDFKEYNTLTLTIADGAGGSVIISMVALKVDNRGYPEETRLSISDIMAAQSKHIYEGVMSTIKKGP